MRRRGGWLALWLLAACDPRADDGRGDNRCESSTDCPQPSYCAVQHGLCALAEPTKPYPLVLQVSNLGEAAMGLSRFTFPAETLARERDDLHLAVRAGVAVEGSVLGSGAAPGPVFAEVSFLPRGDQTGLAPPVVVTTGSDAQPVNLRATLAPGVEHDVVIYPLGAKSALLPPARTRHTTGQPFSFTYPQLDELEGWLFDEQDNPRGGLWLRILAGTRREASDEPDPYQPDQVVSSLAIVGASPEGDGENDSAKFTLKVLPGVLGVRDYVLQVNLSPERPWSTTIELDASRVELASDGRVYIPVVPAKVFVQNRVEAEGGAQAAEASLVLESTYPVPSTPGAVNDRDWCRAKRLGDRGTPFRCRTRITGSTDAEGTFELDLLPGDYRLYISPSRDTESTRLKTTSAYDLKVDTQPGGGGQLGQLYTLRDVAKEVFGSVQGFHGPMRDALIRLVPLGGIPVTGVEAYNRSSDVVSDERGEFVVPCDVGYFDIVTRAPEGSGYASVYSANRYIDRDLPVGAYVLPPPVLVSGVVSVAGQAAPGARIDAYALVRVLGSPGRRRGVQLASAVADEAGRYSLLLPPAVDDDPPEQAEP